jgi:flagellar secretion chaperone FliS
MNLNIGVFLMNYHSMMKNYKVVDVQSKLEEADSHEFINIVLRELLTNMRTLSLSIKDGPGVSDIKSKAFSQSLSSIMILQSSLDFEKGQPIANNLNDLYNYCKKEIINGFKELKSDGIDTAILVITDIFEAWVEIKKKY